MTNKVVVLAIFKDEAAADAAAHSLKDSGLAEDDAIGVLVLDHKGEVKVDKVGKRSTGKGAGIGLALALFSPVGLAAGVIGGSALGALHHKGLGLDREERDRIAAALGDGKAAVGVLAPAAETVAVMAGLTELEETPGRMRSPMKILKKPTPRPTAPSDPPRPRLELSASRP